MCKMVKGKDGKEQVIAFVIDYDASCEFDMKTGLRIGCKPGAKAPVTVSRLHC